MGESKRNKSIPSNLEIQNEALFFGTIKEGIDYLNIASRYIEAIQSYQSIRLIVLETWLLLDYSIRQLILSGLNLSQFMNEDFDLASNLLPKSFRNCLNLLIKLRDLNHHLPQEPPQYPFTGSLDYISYLNENDRESVERIEELTKEYCKANSISEFQSNLDDDKFRFVKDEWLRIVDQINNEWQKKAERIYFARNLAAHSYDDQAVAKKLGFNGKTSLYKVRKYCLKVFEDMLGIKPSIDN